LHCYLCICKKTPVTSFSVCHLASGKEFLYHLASLGSLGFFSGDTPILTLISSWWNVLELYELYDSVNA
jgi:hypothetical protein